MYYEKWGFMLIFWNLAGVPMSYCHCTLYLALHDPSEYAWNPVILGTWAAAYLFVYWVWDTCNSQKNIFRAEEKGGTVLRKTFPQLPWRKVVNPRTIKVDAKDGGGVILCDGWCMSSFPLSLPLHPPLFSLIKLCFPDDTNNIFRI
jgi:delta24(24(1))-sterol reductase